MAYIKYEFACHECDNDITIFLKDDVEDEPTFCPVCGVAIRSNEPVEDDGE